MTKLFLAGELDGEENSHKSSDAGEQEGDQSSCDDQKLIQCNDSSNS